MSLKTIGVLGNLSADTERGPSPSIWNANGSNNAWVADYLQDPRLGLYFWEDFKNSGITPGTGSAANFVAENGWYAYGDTAGVLTDAAILGGGLTFGGGTTDNAGIAIGSLTSSYQIITSGAAYQGRMYFETRVAMTTAALTTSSADMFIGLVDNLGKPAAAMPITATDGVLSTTPGLIGFFKRGGSTTATDWNFVYQLASGTAVYPTNLQSLVTTVTGTAPVGGTYYKLGFVFNPQAEAIQITSASTGQTAGTLFRPLIQVYVNGVAAAAFLTSTNVAGAAFPTSVLAPVIAFRMCNTTASMTGTVDWISVVQESLA